jgi:FkbM family methyltransferase
MNRLMWGSKLIRFVRFLPTRYRRIRAYTTKIGLRGALQLEWIRIWGDRRRSGVWKIRVRGWRRPVVGRYGASDLKVFLQIFGEQEHAPVVALLERRRGDNVLVLDCGANAGYASIFFLLHFPEATITAVEPDDENFRLLEANIGGLEPRVTLVHAGLWSHEAMLGCSNLGFRDGQHWGRQVYEADAEDADARPAVTVPQLLKSSGCDRLALLKMDIEGAEAVVFAANCSEWLQRTDVIAIELHDDSGFGAGTEVFGRAISGQGFELDTSGELTIAYRRNVNEQIPVWPTIERGDGA